MKNLVDALDLKSVNIKHHDILLLVPHQSDTNNEGRISDWTKLDLSISISFVGIDLLNEAHFNFVTVRIQCGNHLRKT